MYVLNSSWLRSQVLVNHFVDRCLGYINLQIETWIRFTFSRMHSIFFSQVCGTVLKPMWTYGIELWGCATKSNVAFIQRYQSKLLRTITNAPWYVSNQTLLSYLHIPHVRTVFRKWTATHHTTLDSHPNPLMEPLAHPPNNRRLKRRWAFDEIH
jgi:hypothetical protein